MKLPLQFLFGTDEAVESASAIQGRMPVHHQPAPTAAVGEETLSAPVLPVPAL